MVLKKKYWVDLKCSNCGKEFTMKIPVGVTILEYLKNIDFKCNKCKCTGQLKKA